MRIYECAYAPSVIHLVSSVSIPDVVLWLRYVSSASVLPQKCYQVNCWKRRSQRALQKSFVRMVPWRKLKFFNTCASGIAAHVEMRRFFVLQRVAIRRSTHDIFMAKENLHRKMRVFVVIYMFKEKTPSLKKPPSWVECQSAIPGRQPLVLPSQSHACFERNLSHDVGMSHHLRGAVPLDVVQSF